MDFALEQGEGVHGKQVFLQWKSEPLGSRSNKTKRENESIMSTQMFLSYHTDPQLNIFNRKKNATSPYSSRHNLQARHKLNTSYAEIASEKIDRMKISTLSLNYLQNVKKRANFKCKISKYLENEENKTLGQQWNRRQVLS